MSWSFRSDAETIKVWLELDWPADLDTKQVAMFLQALHSNYASKYMRFIIWADISIIRHYLVVPLENAQNVVNLLNSFLPDVEIAEAEPFRVLASGSLKLTMSTKNRVLDTDQPELVSNVILNALTDLQDYEYIIMEWVLGGKRSPMSIGKLVRQYRSTSFGGRLVESFFRSPKELDSVEHSSMQAKYAMPSWRANMFVAVEAQSRQRSNYLTDRIAHALSSARRPGVALSLGLAIRPRMDTDYKPFFWSLLVNTSELTGLLAWPLGSQSVPGVHRITSRHIALPDDAPESSRILAMSNVSGSDKTLSLNVEDSMMHTHVIGPTGSGKSTLLLNLITQDIQQGYGVVVVDPKGDLITDTLKRIPDHRRDDVVVIDPSDIDCPVGLNPLARHGQSPSLVADGILSIFRGLYGSNFGPRTEDILHAGILTLCSVPGMSLCSLPILYTNAAFRNRLVSKINDPLGLGSFWGWFNSLSEAERNRVLAPLSNKLRALTMRPSMRRVVGQGHPKFDMGEIIYGKKIVLVSLAKGSLGSENSRLFGSLVVAQTLQIMQGRITMPMEKRLPVFVYVDEIQDYIHTDINTVLEQARGYRMSLVLAHQHLGQLPPHIRASVLSNARSRVCFQLTHEDAFVMSRNSSVLTPGDFERLQRYNIYAQLVRNGEVQPWVSGETMPPIEQISNPAVIKVLSRNRYGRNGAEVDAGLVAQIEDNKSEVSDVVIGRKSKAGGES